MLICFSRSQNYWNWVKFPIQSSSYKNKFQQNLKILPNFSRKMHFVRCHSHFDSASRLAVIKKEKMYVGTSVSLSTPINQIFRKNWQLIILIIFFSATHQNEKALKILIIVFTWIHVSTDRRWERQRKRMVGKKSTEVGKWIPLVSVETVQSTKTENQIQCPTKLLMIPFILFSLFLLLHVYLFFLQPHTPDSKLEWSLT